MRRQLFIIISLIAFIVLLRGFFLTIHYRGEKNIDKTRTVYIDKTDNGFQLYRSGSPFYIRGASGDSNFKDLSSINGNTVRLYDTLNLSNVLDEAERYGLAVIADIPLPKYDRQSNLYLNETNNTLLKQKIKALVKKHRNHPALLMWNLGNELSYPFVFWKNNFIETFNDLIDIIHQEDPNHPICTSIAGVSRKVIASINVHSPQIDLLSFNIFGNTKNFSTNIDQISTLFGSRPYYISEWGSDGPWECRYTSWYAPIEPTSVKKAEQIRTRYKIITENKDEACLGSLVFYWGNKLEYTYTWYSFYLDNYKSEIIKELESLWSNSNTEPSLIGLDYMLLDGKGAMDNIILAPNELISSEIVFSKNKKDSIRIKWEIFPDVWYQSKYETKYTMGVDHKKTVNSFQHFENNKAVFITPETEGPYRIFAYIYDKNGYFATTNTPFYVLNNK